MKKKITGMMLLALLMMLLGACGAAGSGEDGAEGDAVSTTLAKIDAAAWQYNEDDDVYYQTGIAYCESPADESYETLAVFVPGGYMTAEQNEDGTYTCQINTEKEVGGFTAADAPIVMPINTPGYSAQAALTEYSSVSEYTGAGFVYVHAGCRGRDAGAPAGVTDLKAAVRYLRYTDAEVPGSAEKIFTFGMSGGGAQSALMGSTGDSSLYEPYLEQIGAVSGCSDAVLGAMCWCPITNLDTADEAYEWMMGSTRSDLSEEEQEISDRLGEAFVEYINQAGIKDPDGNVLMLEESGDGIWQAGSYYDYMKSVIEGSLNTFLAETEFPYDASASDQQGGPGNGGGHPDFGNGERPDFANGERPDFADRGSADGGGQAQSDASANEDGADADASGSEENGGENQSGDSADQSQIDNIQRQQTTGGLSLIGTYDTAQDYIDALNENGEWVSYDATTNTAQIADIESFVSACKTASKSLGAFDQLDGGQGENTLFGYGDGNGAHFDRYLAEILKETGSSYAQAYEEDLQKTDAAGNTVDTRLAMYTPLYYLLESEKGYGSSTPAKYWRIRTGIAQGDCALSTEVDLALALQQYEGVESVDFATVWGAGHTQAEVSGTSAENFIDWVKKNAAK